MIDTPHGVNVCFEMQSPTKASRVPYHEQARSPGMPSAHSKSSKDAAELAQAKQKVVLLERELADSERTHQLR